MKLLILIVSLTLVKTQLSTFNNSTININEEKSMEVRDTFNLLEEGQRKILMSTERNLVLVLGNTGSGKSTFIQWLFGNNKKLVAKKTADGTFIIENELLPLWFRTIESKTLFPELVMDNKTSTAYYDCPGFSDTRNTSYDIAATYFIKRVADHAKRIKLVFIVNFTSVRKGVDRIDFMKLLTDATDLIKDISKFRDSIAIVATEVDNLFKEDEDGNPVLIPDDVIINGIAEFLVDLKDVLAQDSSKAKYVQLVNVFLSKNSDGSYDRIGLFRRPLQEGPLSEIPMLQSGKNHVFKILDNIVFASKSAEDFGFTISDRSKADIIYLLRGIDITVEENLSKIGFILIDHYHVLVANVEKKLNVFMSENSVDVNVNEEIEEINKILILGIREISGMMEKFKILKSPSEIPEVIRSGFSNLKLELPINEALENISKQGEYFDFLQLVSKKSNFLPKFWVRAEKSWVSQFENTVQYLVELGDKFELSLNDSVIVVKRRINELISQFGLSLTQHYAWKIKEAKIQLLNFVFDSTFFSELKISEIKNTIFTLKDGLTILSSMRAPLSNPLELKRIIYSSIFDINEFRISEIYLRNVSFQVEILNFLLMARGLQFHSPQHWLSTVQNVNRNFSISLKAFTNTVAKKTSAIVYSQISNDLRFMAEKIKKQCAESIFNSLENLNACYIPFLNLSIESYHPSSLVTFLYDIVNNGVKKFNIDEIPVKNVVKRIAFLEYVQALSDRDLLSVIPFMAFQPFNDVFKFVREAHEWYYFLISLNLRFSEFEIQSDASRYNVANLDDWGKVNKPLGISVDKNNFHQFLDKLTHVFIDDDIRSMEIRDVHLAALDKILETNLRSTYKADCENKENIVLRGNFIKFSDFIDGKGAFKNPCQFQAQKISIFASKTVFVDRDLMASGRGFQISIMAPRWEVIGHGRLIVLDGTGGAVGSFLGIGRFFINGAQLKISAIGVSGKVNIIELGLPSGISKS